MASEFTQESSVQDSIGQLATTTPLANNLMQQIRDENEQSVILDAEKPAVTDRDKAGHSGPVRPNSMIPNSNYKQINDVQLIGHRQVRFDERARRQMELLCEDRISKYKFEEVHCSLPSSVKSTFIMTFSPDGQRVASTHGDHRIYICDLNTGKLLDTLEGHPKTPWCLAWHPSNREILASGCLAGEVRVWDLKSKACESWTSENHTIITSLDFHPKERVLVVATANDVHFWDWGQSEPFAKTTTMHDREKVKFVVFDSSGTKLITGISNLPRFAGYSSDSLQNRIIDGYLSQSTIEPLPTEIMTQNSEIATSPINGSVNTNENIIGQQRDATSASLSSRVGANNIAINPVDLGSVNPHDLSYRNTMLLTRVANLYRQLESLEDSLRHTSFAPFISLPASNAIPVRASVENGSGSRGTQTSQPNAASDETQSSSVSSASVNLQPAVISAPSTADQSIATSSSPLGDSPAGGASQTTTPSIPITTNTFEPHVVTFDESLEQLQLPPLIIDGQEINLATVIDNYPVDLSRQMYHAMQFDSINQVSQNFIRISKLMSSARLYRQVVQQIVSSDSRNGSYQPNQILTAQSVTPRSPRSSPNAPIVLRNFPLSGNTLEANGLLRSTRHDPILAIEFRNSARNVPLVTICKIELIAARAICILRSQLLVEQALGLDTRHETSSSNNTESSSSSAINESAVSSNSTVTSNSRFTPLQTLIGKLHATLMTISHTPLTTSNAFAHITTLRMQTESLHNALASMLNSEPDGRRLSELMHKIAFSLTGRRWSLPLGATLDEIRLDVIHTLCIVDLSLHMTRQVQLLQMQRVSLISRVHESQRSSGTANTVHHSSVPQPMATSILESGQSIMTTDEPSTSFDGGVSVGGGSSSSSTKRKVSESNVDCNKRQRMTNEQRATSESSSSSNENNTTTAPVNVSPVIDPQQNQQTLDQGSLAADRMILWNAQHGQIDHSPQRFVVATSSHMNSHILVRVYHRMPGVQHVYPYSPSSSLYDSQQELRVSAHIESRRRALSQDHSIEFHDPVAAPSSGASAAAETSPPRIRVGVRAPPAIQVVPPGFNYHNPVASGAPFDAWQRHPHLHVYQTRGPGPHLWFNQWTIPLPVNSSNYRLQCWNFSRDSIPNIKNSQSNVITHKCRIHNDSSIDVSSNGNLVACLVPRDENCFPNFDLKIFSLRSCDFGACYYKLSQSPNAMSVSLSPSGTYAIVGLASHKVIGYDQNEDSLTIGKVYKIAQKVDYIRDIKIKRDDTSLSLNAIKWLPRGIVYNVGPQHHQRYQTARVRNVVAS